MSKRERLCWKGLQALFGIVVLVLLGSAFLSLVRYNPYRLYLVWRMRRTAVDLMVMRAVCAEVGRLWLERTTFRSSGSVDGGLSPVSDDGAWRGFSEELLDTCGEVAEYGNTFLPAIVACSIVIGLTCGVAVTVSQAFSFAAVDPSVCFPMLVSEEFAWVGSSFVFVAAPLSRIAGVRLPARVASWIVVPLIFWITCRFGPQAAMGLYLLRNVLTCVVGQAASRARSW